MEDVYIKVYEDGVEGNYYGTCFICNEMFIGHKRDRDCGRHINFRQAVIDELVNCGIFRLEHETNPRLAIHDIINWNVAVALDPAVSVDAINLIEKYGGIV